MTVDEGALPGRSGLSLRRARLDHAEVAIDLGALHAALLEAVPGERQQRFEHQAAQLPAIAIQPVDPCREAEASGLVEILLGA